MHSTEGEVHTVWVPIKRYSIVLPLTGRLPTGSPVFSKAFSFYPNILEWCARLISPDDGWCVLSVTSIVVDSRWEVRKRVRERETTLGKQPEQHLNLVSRVFAYLHVLSWLSSGGTLPHDIWILIGKLLIEFIIKEETFLFSFLTMEHHYQPNWP